MNCLSSGETCANKFIRLCPTLNVLIVILRKITCDSGGSSRDFSIFICLIFKKLLEMICCEVCFPIFKEEWEEVLKKRFSKNNSNE